MRSRLTAVVLCCTALFPLAAHAGKSAVLVDPPTFEVSADAKPAQIGKGIKQAMVGQRWAVDTERPGYVEGKYTGGGWWVRVAVSYVGHSVSIRYLTSDGLNFSDKGDRRYIHANYLKWVKALAGAIPHSVESALNE